MPATCNWTSSRVVTRQNGKTTILSAINSMILPTTRESQKSFSLSFGSLLDFHMPKRFKYKWQLFFLSSLLFFFFRQKKFVNVFWKRSPTNDQWPIVTSTQNNNKTRHDVLFSFFLQNFLFRDENYCEIKFKKKKGTPPDKHDSLHPLLFLSRHPSSACTDNPTTSTVNK